MAAPMKLKLLSPLNRKWFQSNSVLISACREYRTKQRKLKPSVIRTTTDPRQNAKYPYTPGEQLQHEEPELIQKLNHVGNNGNDHRQEKLFTRLVSMPKANGLINDNKFEKHNNKDRNKKKHVSVSRYGHVYEKLNEGDFRLGRTILQGKSSMESKTILLEGQRLIREAIALGAELKYLYFSTEDTLKDFSPSLLQDNQIYKIPYKDMKTWSDTTTPSGILGVFKKPEQGEFYSSEEPRLPLTVILDSVKDPGNLGTLIRSAAAVGCERILVLKGSANVWEGKVLRSGMGSHFAVPIYSGLTWSQVYGYIEDSTRVFLADARAENDVVNAFDRVLSLEQVDHASSTDRDCDGSSSDSEVDDSYHAETSVQNEVYQRVSFPVISYSNVILHPSPSGKKENVALVIGNECLGLSPSAKRFAYKCYGTFVTVPMNQAVDSLNTAIAGSIILYELRRKMLDLDSIASSVKG